MKYADTIAEIKKTVDDLEKSGVTVTALSTAIEQLEQHNNDAHAVEENIEAIRSEVIEPIKGELAENKLAGTFSRFGFYAGALGILASVAATWYNLTNDRTPEILEKVQVLSSQLTGTPKSNDNVASNPATEMGLVTVIDKLSALESKVNQIETRLLFPEKVSVGRNEAILKRFTEHKDMPVIPGSSPQITFGFYNIGSRSTSSKILANLDFLRDKRGFNVKLSGSFKFVRSGGLSALRKGLFDERVVVAKGDAMFLNGVKISILEVYSTDLHGRLTGDEFDGIKYRIEQIPKSTE